MADEILEKSRPNQWGAAKYAIKTLLLLGLPAYLLPTLILMLIPILQKIAMAVFALQLALYFTKLKWGVGFSDIPRFIRSQINGNKLHGHSVHRKRSGTSFWVAGAMCLMFVPQAHASYELVLPSPNTRDSAPTIKSNLISMPMIERGIVRQGFGHDIPLGNVMDQLIHNSWKVNYRDAELRNLPISWRSERLDIIEILEDLSERYSITFRYSNRSGVLHIEWTGENCKVGKDNAGIYNIIC